MMDSREFEIQQRERQYQIDRITARYAAEIEAGRHPDIKAYITQNPEYAAEIADFIATYHLSLVDLPKPEEDTVSEVQSVETLAPIFARAQAKRQAQLAAIEAQLADRASEQTAPALTGLVDRAFEVDLDPESLATRVDVSPSFIARLDARAIAAASIPRELFRRLAEALDVTSEAISGFLGASVQTGGAFFHASEAPTSTQDDFLAAIGDSDDMTDAQKAAWRAISASEKNG